MFLQCCPDLMIVQSELKNKQHMHVAFTWWIIKYVCLLDSYADRQFSATATSDPAGEKNLYIMWNVPYVTDHSICLFLFVFLLKKTNSKVIQHFGCCRKPAAESSRLLTSFDDITIGNRLKPPPSCINFEKKTIKLGSSKAASNSVNKPDSTSALHNKTATVSTSPKVIKLNRSTSSSSDPKSPPSPHKTISLSKTVKLINSHLSGSGQEVGAKLASKSEDAKKEEQPMVNAYSFAKSPMYHLFHPSHLQSDTLHCMC